MKTIPLTNGGDAIVDDADYPVLARHKWHWITSGHGHHGGRYASRMTQNAATGKWKRLLMHRVIIAAPDGVKVDHRNRDSLDNQRENLRLATNSQNAANSVHRPNRSGYRGVYLTQGRYWYVFIAGTYLGTFPDAESAARAYDDAARERFGEFARVNFPLHGEQSCREVAS
jgi:hypothetical protein